MPFFIQKQQTYAVLYELAKLKHQLNNTNNFVQSLALNAWNKYYKIGEKSCKFLCFLLSNQNYLVLFHASSVTTLINTACKEKGNYTNWGILILLIV